MVMVSVSDEVAEAGTVRVRGRRGLEVEGRGGGHGDHAGAGVDREGVAGVAGGDGPCDGVVVARVGEVDDRRGGGGGLGDRAGRRRR